MFEKNDSQAQHTWTGATPHVTLTGTAKREYFTYSYTLEVRRSRNGFVGRRTGTVTEEANPDRPPYKHGRSRGGPFALATRYAFMTPHQLQEWVQKHNASKA